MYIPAKRNIGAIIQQRPGEAGKPADAAARASITAIALAVVPAILDRLAFNTPGLRALQDTREPQTSGKMLVSVREHRAF